jgi:L-lactate dehydrogenase (cytochrome)
MESCSGCPIWLHVRSRKIANAQAPNQTLFRQIYAKTNLDITEKEINRAVELGYKRFALTVDAIRMYKRQRDLRLIIEEEEVRTLLNHNKFS